MGRMGYYNYYILDEIFGWQPKICRDSAADLTEFKNSTTNNYFNSRKMYCGKKRKIKE